MLDEPYVLHTTEAKRIGALVFDGVHFDVLKPDGDVYPQALLDISAGPPQVPMRGGRKVFQAKLHAPHSTHSTLYTPHFTLYAVHSTLCTQNSTLDTLHSTLYTFHSTL